MITTHDLQVNIAHACYYVQAVSSNVKARVCNVLLILSRLAQCHNVTLARALETSSLSASWASGMVQPQRAFSHPTLDAVYRLLGST